MKLSETGLFASVKDHKVAPGIISYSVNAEPWADGTTARRYLALPGTSTIATHTVGNTQKGFLKGEWKFPNNTVLMKTVFLQTYDANPRSRRRIETQVLHLNGEQWNAYNYVWNDRQTDAVRMAGPGRDAAFFIADKTGGTKRRQTWHHASRTECLLCHTSRGGTIYGFEPRMLSDRHSYGSNQIDQFATLKHIGLFESDAAKLIPQKRKQAIPNPHDTKVDIAKRARAYLHVNCSSCHRRGGGGTSQFELLFGKSKKDKYFYDHRPTQGTFGIHNAKVIAPGDPYRSVLLYRMAKLGRGRMPHFGSGVVDRKGLQLIHDWIHTLDKTPDANPSVKSARIQLMKIRIVTMMRPSAKKDRIRRLATPILSSTEGALVLATKLGSEGFSGNASRWIIDLASKHPDPQVRDLFEPFLPEEQRVKRLGTTVDAVALLKLKGDVARGRALFLRTDGVSCANCHKVGDKGKEIGPDLSHIAKKNTRAQLLESILQPSKTIDKKYLVYLVETKKGKVVSGLLKQRDAKQVVLTDSQGKAIRIPAGDVEQIVPQRKSLMPELLFRDMTARQLADLLAFLQSLK